MSRRYEGLAPSIDEASVRRVWHGVGRLRTRRRSLRRGAVLVAAALVVGAVAAAISGAPSESVGPLRRASGAPVDVELASAVAHTFDDGSSLTLRGAAAPLEVLENDSQTVRLQLREGTLEVEVRPGGPRRWVVEAGHTQVRVVGTRFAVERDEDRVRTTVQRGTVLVRSPWLPEGVRRLEAGESVVCGPPVPEMEPEEEPQAAVTPSPPVVEPALDEGAAPPTAAAPASALVLPSPPTPAAAPVNTPAELLAVADEARMTGHPRDAAEALERLLVQHPDDPSAALAALTLGRLELRRLARPRRAIEHLGTALGASSAPAIASSALALRSEAYRAVGDSAHADHDACAYLDRFPEGARRDEMERACPER